ncbi:MAG: hypothetical protein IKN35_02465, partial [Lachnospiraceae bacterium]|nr:hypothetical protein [Lachnospiraceae bacterium]
MNEIREVADLFDNILKEKKIEKYTYTLVKSEKQEINAENGEFKLMRTVFNNYASIKVFKDSKMGSASGNDLSAEALKRLADDSVSAAESSPEDPCHDIAPDQGKEVFKQGIYEPDMDRFIERIPESGIIPVDFDQPREPVYTDSTAAAIAACGLIELARVEEIDPEQAKKYK